MPYLDTFIGYEVLMFSDGVIERTMFQSLTEVVKKHPYVKTGLEGVQVYKVYFVGVYYHNGVSEAEVGGDRDLKAELLDEPKISIILEKEEQCAVKEKEFQDWRRKQDSGRD